MKPAVAKGSQEQSAAAGSSQQHPGVAGGSQQLAGVASIRHLRMLLIKSV